jgi:hypothetical protein
MVSLIRSRSNRQVCLIFVASLCILLFPLLMNSPSSFAAIHPPSMTVQHSKSTSPHVGSAMAVLATLEQAQVLPPEGSREADRVIQSVIQFQSAFAKGTDRSIQDFAQRAVADKHGEHTTTILERFRSGGWTADLLEALADADKTRTSDELQPLATGFGQFNLSVDDFKRFMQLVRDGRSALAARGQNFQDVYARHRNTMPGAAGR